MAKYGNMSSYDNYSMDREAIRKKLMEITNDAKLIEDVLSQIDDSVDKSWHDGFHNS